MNFRVNGRVLAVMAALTALVSSCGDSPNTGTHSKSSGGVATPAAQARVASVSPSDSSIAISPRTYATPGDPCAGLIASIAFSDAADACASEWGNYLAVQVPGQDVMDNAAGSKTVRVQKGVSAPEADAAATAFYRWEVFSEWAASNAPGGETLLESPNFPTALGQAAINHQSVYEVPACDFFTQLRVVKLSGASAGAFIAHGMVAESGDVAIVATWPQCAGDLVSSPREGGGRIRVGATSHAYSSVSVGRVVNAGPFGKIYQFTGYLVCGLTSGISAECGAAS